MQKKNPDKLKFSAIQLTFWCSWCAFTSFSALFFKGRGLSEAQIGFALSLSTLGGIAGQFVWGILCDKLKTIKKNFIAANLMIWGVILSFIWIRGSFWVLALMFLLGFAQVPQPSILDTWILKRLPGKEEEYGHIRLWASLGFAFFALGFGWVIQRLGFASMFAAASFFILLTLILSLKVPDADKDGSNRVSLAESFKELLTNKRYLFFILVCFLIGLAFRTAHLLLPLIISHVKGASGDLGLAYFFGVITEIPMLLASKKLSERLSSPVLILISVVLFILHFLVLIAATASWMIMGAMLLQGLAFGNYLPSVRLFVYENAPSNLRTSAQTLADALCSSLTAVIGSAAGGVIIQNYGVKTVLIIGTGLLGTALATLLAYVLKSGKKT